MNRRRVVAAGAGLAILALMGATIWRGSGSISREADGADTVVTVVNGHEAPGIQRPSPMPQGSNEFGKAYTPIPGAPYGEKMLPPLNLREDIEPSSMEPEHVAADSSQLTPPQDMKTP